MYRIASLCVALALMTGQARAQNEQVPSTNVADSVAKTQQIKNETQGRNDSQRPVVGTRSNVKIDLSISDQRGDGPPEKKLVSMIVSEMAWGKIRTHADHRPPSGGPPMTIALNVDARPYLTTSGQIQLELVVNYNPLDETNKIGIIRPTELNQSMTVVLQSGKPLVVAQAADPIVDRKMIVEVVATILK